MTEDGEATRVLAACVRERGEAEAIRMGAVSRSWASLDASVEETRASLRGAGIAAGDLKRNMLPGLSPWPTSPLAVL